jgi:EAL domain-containing protein (putative c-di-GMP-specific phosphodiesterase class I)
VAVVPPEPKLDEAAAAFVAADARFVVIGGFAVIANRFVRATEDVDFLVPDDVDNDRRVLAALRTLDGVRMRDEAPLSDEHLSGQAHLRALTRAGIIDVVRGGLPPLDFEITETAAITNMADARAFAQTVTSLGCGLGLDDFGTGFSSFSYLKELPVQHLKLDIEFIRELPSSPGDQRLVQAMVQFAKALGQETVAEGIEDAETLALVRAFEVDYAQGFHIGEPARVDSAQLGTVA